MAHVAKDGAGVARALAGTRGAGSSITADIRLDRGYIQMMEENMEPIGVV